MKKTMKGYVARDRDGKLFLFQKKPGKLRNIWVGIHITYALSQLPKSFFPHVKWSDKEPTRVTLTIEED